MSAVPSPDTIPSPNNIIEGRAMTTSISGNPTTLHIICTTIHVQIHLDLIKIWPANRPNKNVNVHWMRSELMSRGIVWVVDM